MVVGGGCHVIIALVVKEVTNAAYNRQAYHCPLSFLPFAFAGH